MKTMSFTHALWRDLERSGTAEKFLKTRPVAGAFWWYLKRFGTAEKK